MTATFAANIALLPLVTSIKAECLCENFKILPCNVIITLKDEKFNPIRSWNIVGAYPVKMETSQLGANKSELAIETLELAFNYFSEREEK